MWEAPTRQALSQERLHLQHGPIDVVLRAWGRGGEVRRAKDAAWERFQTMLAELSTEIGDLRRPMSEAPQVRSPTAQRMVRACGVFAGHFITPMAAVAGAVADEVLASMTGVADLDKAFVNDGGDIALHLAEGESMILGIAGGFGRGPAPGINGALRVQSGDPVRGVATSGARGRSFSLGIADSVTVLAASAAVADAAATLIANAVDLDHPGIIRAPARTLDPDSDLGDRLVTISAPPLGQADITAALAAGLAAARSFKAQGLIVDAALMLQGEAASLSDHFDHVMEIQQ
jgi:ApbE superfamily uncharacterized protein (UPF0280 family)